MHVESVTAAMSAGRGAMPEQLSESESGLQVQEPRWPASSTVPFAEMLLLVALPLLLLLEPVLGRAATREKQRVSQIDDDDGDVSRWFLVRV